MPHGPWNLVPCDLTAAEPVSLSETEMAEATRLFEAFDAVAYQYVQDSDIYPYDIIRAALARTLTLYRKVQHDIDAHLDADIAIEEADA